MHGTNQIAHVIAAIGWTPEKLAAELGVTLRTVKRWTAGQHRPAKRNNAKLRTLVGGMLLDDALYNPRTVAAARRLRALEAAADLLLTPAERAVQAAYDAELKARFAPIAQELYGAPGPSVTATVDPFELCRDRRSDRIDAAFAA